MTVPKRRWYDQHYEANEVINVLQNLDEQSKKQLATDLLEIIKQIKEFRKENEFADVSIGLKRVLGLYQMNNSRRWYDRNSELECALKMIFTLPDEDFLNIMEGLFISFNG